MRKIRKERFKKRIFNCFGKEEEEQIIEINKECIRILWEMGFSVLDKDKRGLRAEKKVYQCLNDIKRQRVRFPGGIRIKTVSLMPHFSLEDLSGKDIIVGFLMETGREKAYFTLPIQVKDWWTWEEEINFRERGICLISVWSDEDKEEARKRVFNALYKWFRQFRENSAMA